MLMSGKLTRIWMCGYEKELAQCPFVQWTHEFTMTNNYTIFVTCFSWMRDKPSLTGHQL